MKKIKIEGREIFFTNVYRNVRVARLEFEYGIITLILPYGYKDEELLLKKHIRWIKNRYADYEEIKSISKTISFLPEISDQEFKLFVIEKIKVFSKELNVKIKEVVFKNLQSRLGSCASNGKITINLNLRFLPTNLIEYIIFHEVAHMLEIRHNSKFYYLIDQKFGDRKKIEKELSVYWYLLKTQELKEKI